jgi:hypothetical protein
MEIDCNVQHAYNWEAQRQCNIGYILYLDIANTQLPADQGLRKPTTGRQQRVVGVIEQFEWKQTVEQSLYFTCHVTATNKYRIEQLIHGSWATRQVVLSFAIYQYDKEAKVYFERIGAVKIQGTISEEKGQLVLSTSERPSYHDTYTLDFGVDATHEEQDIHRNTGLLLKDILIWQKRC